MRTTKATTANSAALTSQKCAIPDCEELRQNYIHIIEEPSFKEEFDQLLKDYVERPTPLYFAKRMSEK